MKSRRLAHVTAVAVAVTVLLSAPCTAHAFIVFPVDFSGLEPGVRNIGFGCEITDSSGQIVGGGGVPLVSVRRGLLDTVVR